MKYNEKNDLCLTHADYVACFGLIGYKNHKRREHIITYGVGGNGREVLIDYEALAPERKAVVIEKYGNPYEYVVKQPLIDWVNINRNKKAFDYYNNTGNKGYKLPNGLNLPEDYRDKYTKAVTYMDAIVHYTTDKLALKRDFNINMEAFWRIVADVIKAEDVHLPRNEKRLKERLRDYKTQGFDLLIEAFRFGNDNRAKIKGQQAEDVLMKLIANDNKHDDVVIAAVYNQWAVANGHETITPGTVGYRRRTRYHEVIMERDGKSIAYNTYNKQIKRSRATSPLMLINSDDNVLDLFFINPKTKSRYDRPVMYVVMDTFNDYILGYAVGDVVTKELIKEAYRNAMAHIVDLTGQAYLWGQIISDKWAIDPKLVGELPTFFKMGGETTFFPSSVAQGKYIERVFGKPLHKILKLFPNYSGANITAHGKNARPNPDALQKRSASFPDRKHMPSVVEMIINQMRHALMPDGDMTRQEAWLKAFKESEYCKQRLISTERKLELLGVRHEAKEPVRLRVKGINFQLHKKQYSFDIPANYFPQHNNKAVEMYYDPADMSEVLVTDHKGIRFLAGPYQYQPAAIADMQEGHGKMLHDRKEESRDITRQLENLVEQRNARLQANQIQAEGLLQAGILTKAINHKAQKVISGAEDIDFIPVQVSPNMGGSIYDEM